MPSYCNGSSLVVPIRVVVLLLFSIISYFHSGLVENVLSHQSAGPFRVLRCFAKFKPVANNDKFPPSAGHGNVQPILIEKAGGPLHKCKQNYIRLLALALIYCQNTCLCETANWPFLELKLNFALLILILFGQGKCEYNTVIDLLPSE